MNACLSNQRADAVTITIYTQQIQKHLGYYRSCKVPREQNSFKWWVMKLCQFSLHIVENTGHNNRDAKLSNREHVNQQTVMISSSTSETQLSVLVLYWLRRWLMATRTKGMLRIFEKNSIHLKWLFAICSWPSIQNLLMVAIWTLPIGSILNVLSLQSNCQI